MCGIAGFYGKGSLEDLKAINSTHSYRGPDANDVFEGPGIYLGHQRLSILDLENGKQPMKSICGRYVIVFNGEIYNHLELRERLIDKDYKFQTSHSDTETILNGYIEWGSEVVTKLNGMFAFCIYDQEKKSLFLARDHFGQKPLFYTCTKDTFIFSSELRSLCSHSEVRPEVSKLSLKKYFAHDYIPAPRTIFKNIYKLPASNFMKVDLKNLDIIISNYYQLKFSPREYNFNEACDELRLKLAKAVDRCMLSDVSLGVFLSGGIDSSCVANFAAKNSKEPIHTFSIGFEEKSFDESAYAKIVSNHIGSTHHTDTLSIEKAKEVIPHVLSKLDEPLGDASLLPTYLVSKFARENVKVILGGDAGDELFAGYDPFKALRPALLVSKLIPSFGRDIIRGLSGLLPVSHDNMSLDFKIKRFLRAFDYPQSQWNSWWMSSLDKKEFESLFNEKCKPEELFSEAIEEWESCNSNNIVDRTITFFSRMYMQNGILCKVDRSSMMNSLEVRAPFLDLELVEFVMSLPHSYKYKKGITKYILKKSLESELPHDILYRKKKGFGIPIASWLRDEKSFTFKNNSEYMNNDFINSKIKLHRNLKENTKSFLWSLYVLENTYINEYL